MLYSKVYSVTGPGSLVRAQLPMLTRVDDQLSAELAFDGDDLALTVNERVDVTGAELMADRKRQRQAADGSWEPLPRLRIPDRPDRAHVLARDVVSAWPSARERTFVSRP